MKFTRQKRKRIVECSYHSLNWRCELRNRAPSLRTLSEQLLKEPSTRRWLGAVDRTRQLWIGSSEGRKADFPSHRPSSISSQYSQQPDNWFYSFTDYGGRTAFHSLLAHEATDWQIDYPIPQASFVAQSKAIIFEIRGPGDWYSLCTKYGVQKLIDDPPGTRGEMVPDWEAVSRDWDGVHLTFGGFLTSYLVTTEGSGGWARLWSWESERTLWLRPSFERWTEEAGMARQPSPLIEFRPIRLTRPSHADASAKVLRRDLR
jgi:hypothetical protein